MSKLKLGISIALLLIVAVAVACLTAYCRGKRVGEQTVKQIDLKKELGGLEDEKVAIRNNVHAIDNDALRTRILDLAGRTHEEAARGKK